MRMAATDAFEESVSPRQDLSFRKTESVFSAGSLPFGREQMEELGFLRYGAFTGLGVLLSDQCPFTIRAAVFRDSDLMEFQDRREFSGPLFEQIEKCYAFLRLCNPLSATFEGLYRRDSQPYPDSAIREALLNSVIHRDYSCQAAAQVSVCADRMEFLNAGGLLPGIAKEDILLGLSISRNPGLLDIFSRLRLAGGCGTGLQKIRNDYRESGERPQILTAPNSFKLILPHLLPGKEPEDGETLPGKESTPQKEESILGYLKEHQSVTRKDAEALLGVSSATAVRVLRKMAERKVLLRLGDGRNTRYILPDDKR